MTEWQQRVAGVVKSIPPGKTLGYSQVALMAGTPGAARAVVQALKAIEDKTLPWWRVLRTDGSMAPEMVVRQSRLLKAEGVKVIGRRVDAASRWR